LKIKVAIVGAGYMAKEHIKVFNLISDFEVLGIYSRTYCNASKLQADYNIKYNCNSIEELYETTKADLVLITVPVLSTMQVLKESIKFDWVHLIEKPIGHNLSESIEILKMFSELNKKAFASFNRRFFSSTRKVLSSINNSSSKRLISIVDQEDPMATWEGIREKKLIDYWMYANSIHLIDYFRILGRGEIKNVTNVIPWDKCKQTFVSAKIEYESGDIGLYQATWGMAGPWSVSVTNLDGYFELKPLETGYIQKYGDKKAEIIAEDIDLNFKPGLYFQALEIIKAFNKDVNKLVDLEDSLLTMKLVQRIYGI
jgi:predicted dehydrogenase